MAEWFRIRSWHIVDPAPKVPPLAGVKSYCGRVGASIARWTGAPPEDEKTCESCFRARERAG